MKLRRIVACILVLVLLAAAGLAWKIGPRNIIGMLLYDQRREGLLQVGDLAPDVVLRNLAGEEVHLADSMGERPLVLIFGSFT